MSHHRSWPALALLVLLAALVAGLAGASPAAPAAAAPVAPAALTPGPFAHRWSEVTTFAHPADGRTFSDPVNGHLFIISDAPGVNVYNSATGALVRHLSYTPMRRDFNADYSRLYLITGQDVPSDPDVTIHVLDATTLAEIGTLTYACTNVVYSCTIAGLATGPAGRLYVSRANARAIDVLDGVTGAILHTIPFAAFPNPMGVSVAAQGNTLYVGETDPQGMAGLALYDISAVVPVRGGFYPTMMQPQVTLSPGGDYIMTDDMNATRVYRTAPFGFLWSRLNGFAEFGGFDAGGNLLLHERPGDPIRYLIAALDPQTGATTRSLVTGDMAFVRPLAGHGLALFARDTVTLHRASDYALAIQTVWHNACPGGAVEDHFDDPHSGWPTVADEFVSAGYVSGGYQMELRQPNRWLAVSRGDYWNDSLALQISGAQPVGQDGTFGLIFGLNDDWSDFYTAEVYPAENLAGLFHFTGGQWVSLRIDDFVSVPSVGTRMKIRRDPLTDVTTLEFDSHLTWILPDFTGRVGLTATAYGAPVHALFDDYRFVDTYCAGPLPEGRRAPDERRRAAEPVPAANWGVRPNTGPGFEREGAE